MKTVGYILLFAGLMAFLTQTARSADPPAVKVEQKVQVAPVAAPVKAPCPPKVVVVVVPAKAKASETTVTYRVRVFERYRTGDGPVRRTLRAFLSGC